MVYQRAGVDERIRDFEVDSTESVWYRSHSLDCVALDVDCKNKCNR